MFAKEQARSIAIRLETELCPLSLFLRWANVECSLTREVVGVPGNFEQRLVLGHDKPPFGARRAPSLLWRQRNLPDEKPAHYLPSSILRVILQGARRGRERPSFLRSAAYYSVPRHAHEQVCCLKTGQRAHQPPREPRFVRAKPVVDQRNRCRSIPPPLLFLLWLRFRQFPLLLPVQEKKKLLFRASKRWLIIVS